MPIPTLICTCCGRPLTDEERHYYGATCEACEREKTDRIGDWMKGADDPELERMLLGTVSSPPPQTRH